MIIALVPNPRPKHYLTECKFYMSFTLAQREYIAKTLIQRVIDDDLVSLMILGSPGMGKTHTVTSILKENGYVETVIDRFQQRSDHSLKYKRVSGHSSPKGLYEVLYENRDSIVIFDDCDSIFKDAISTNILKAALNTDSKNRQVSWCSDSTRSKNIPNGFLFKGRIIFISNLIEKNIDSAVLDRTEVITLHMNDAEKIEKMKEIVEEPDFLTDVEYEVKQDALSNIIKFRPREMSIRKLIQVIKSRDYALRKGHDVEILELYSINSSRNVSIVPEQRTQVAINDLMPSLKDKLFEF